MKHRILCLGEILFDVYPEYKRLGGAPFNFAYHLHRFGQHVAFVSRIGEDEYGQDLVSHLKKRTFPCQYLQTDAQHPTGTVTVSLDEKGKPEYNITEQVAYDFPQVEEPIRQFVSQGVVLIYFGTLAQRHSVSRTGIQQILGIVPEKAMLFYDINLRQSFYTADILYQSLMKSDVVKLNEEEFVTVSQLFGFSEQKEEAVQQLRQNFSVRTLCITRGAEGSSLVLDDKKFHWENPGESSLKVIDTVGAGDAFAATLAYGILEKWPGESIIQKASQFAAAICTIPGAIPDEPDFYRVHAPFVQS